MIVLLLLLLIGLMAVIAYMLFTMNDLNFLFKHRYLKKKRYPRKTVSVKRMPTAMLVVYYAQGIKEYPITDSQEGFCIGSQDHCDLKIPKSESEFIDGEHALICLDEYSHQYILSDLGSLNGIYNSENQRVESLPLSEGTQFRVANILMEYHQYDPFGKGV